MSQQLPRFPVPFLELMLEYLPWPDVLALASVDTREAPGRKVMFERGLVRVGDMSGWVNRFEFEQMLLNHPNLYVVQTEVASLKGVCDRAKEISFDDEFDDNCQLYVWPPNVKRLTFGTSFGSHGYIDLDHLDTCGQFILTSQKLKNLPSALEYLRFDGDPHLHGVAYPKGLKELDLGYSEVFDRSLQWIKLPSTLVRLNLGEQFNHSLAGVQLPITLNSLVLGDSFVQDLSQIIWPPNLTRLHLGDVPNDGEPINWPAKIDDLKYGRFRGPMHQAHLPTTLTKLFIRCDYFMRYTTPLRWPSGLKELSMYDEEVYIGESLQLFLDHFNDDPNMA
jgi:hypothetical protein